MATERTTKRQRIRTQTEKIRAGQQETAASYSGWLNIFKKKFQKSSPSILSDDILFIILIAHWSHFAAPKCA